MDAAKQLNYSHTGIVCPFDCALDNQRMGSGAAWGASARYPGESAQRFPSRSVSSALFIHKQINDVFIPACCPWCHNHSGGYGALYQLLAKPLSSTAVNKT